MNSIFVAKVYDSDQAGVLNSGRNVGWEKTFDECLEMLQNFGDECRWTLSVIEEVQPGMHGFISSAKWFSYYSSLGWKPFDGVLNDFMRCTNHTIG
jgi:hypothetical protein